MAEDFTDRERSFMRLALAEAERAFDEDEIPVGCVLVHRDRVIGRGRNNTNESRNGTRHCEMEAIEQVLLDIPEAMTEEEACRFWNSVALYVTCEPCIMCAGALSVVGIKTVYYGCSNDKFGGCGSVHPVSDTGCGTCGGSESRFGLGARGFACRKGLYAEEAITLLQDFYTKGNTRAPKPHRKHLWKDRREDQRQNQRQDGGGETE